jgi:hypothetical protein
MEWRKSLHPEYEVSEDGKMRATTDRYRRPSGTIIKGSQNKGYIQYNLTAPGESGRGSSRIGYYAHTLVLNAFIGPRPSNKTQCAHYDGDPGNNHFRNLRWATAAENTEDRVRHGNIYAGHRKLQAEQVKSMRRMRREGASYDTIMAEFPVSKGNLSAVINRKTWSDLPDD